MSTEAKTNAAGMGGETRMSLMERKAYASMFGPTTGDQFA